jgi:hypothetical protein
MIKAICTWGSAADVSIITDSNKYKIPVMVFEEETTVNPLIKSQTVKYYKTYNDIQIPLTSDEAIDLGSQLIKAGIQAKVLDGEMEDV